MSESAAVRRESPSKLSFAKMFNGSFAICPRCKDVMAKGYWAHGILWACLTGCGSSVKTDMDGKVLS